MTEQPYRLDHDLTIGMPRPRPKHPRGPRIKGEARQELVEDIVKRYGRNQSVRQISDAVGHSYGFVHKILKENSAAFRSRGGANRSPERRRS